MPDIELEENMGKNFLINKSFVGLFIFTILISGAAEAIQCSSIFYKSLLTARQLKTLNNLRGKEIEFYLRERGLLGLPQGNIDILFNGAMIRRDGDAVISLVNLFDKRIDISKYTPKDRINFLFESTTDGNTHRFRQLLKSLKIDFSSYEFVGPFDSSGGNAYHVAINKKASPTILELLFDFPLLDINMMSQNRSPHNPKMTPLMLAIKKGEVELVQALLKHPDLVLHTFGYYFTGSILSWIKNDGGHRNDLTRVENGQLKEDRENDRTAILRLILEDPRFGSYPKVDEGASLMGAPYWKPTEMTLILENPWVHVNTLSGEFGSLLHFSITFVQPETFNMLLQRPDIDIYVRPIVDRRAIQSPIMAIYLKTRGKKVREFKYWELVKMRDQIFKVHDRRQRNTLARLDKTPKPSKPKSSRIPIAKPESLQGILTRSSINKAVEYIEDGNFQGLKRVLELDTGIDIQEKVGSSKQDLIDLAVSKTLDRPDSQYEDRVLIRDYLFQVFDRSRNFMHYE